MASADTARSRRQGASSSDLRRTGAHQRPSLVDGAERALRNWLAPGRYRPGDRLPPEHEVASMLGVSRGTLRSALRRLEESGEIVRRQGSGTFVGRMAVPSALEQRLERLEPYSSVAARRGLTLTALELEIARRSAGREAGDALGIAPIAQVVAISRVLAADGVPVAVMTDIVHPGVELPAESRLRASLERGEMVLDVLIAIGIPVTFSRTHVLPTLITPRERAGRLLGIQTVTAALELDELIYAGREERVAYSRDLFAPGGLDVTVLRSLESARPAPVVNFRRQNGASSGAARELAAPSSNNRGSTPSDARRNGSNR